jgi:hypothetical protein
MTSEIGQGLNSTARATAIRTESTESTGIRKCIYCLQQKPLKEFNREHVLHDAFTKNIAENLVLRERVCQECNSELDRRLDVVLTRKTLEATQRFATNMKPLKSLKDVGTGNVSHMATSDDPVYDGIPMVLAEVNGEMGYIPKPHIALLTSGNITRLFVEQLSDRGYKIPHVEPGAVAIYVEGRDEDKALLMRLAEERGFQQQITGERIPGDQSVFGFANQDVVVMRGIAKIAFNYLAFITTAGQPELIFHESFDAAREFILNGKDPNFGIVCLLTINPNATYKDKFHSVRLEQTKLADTYYIMAGVTIFGLAEYQVALSRTSSPIFETLASHHIWDIPTRKCFKMNS